MISNLIYKTYKPIIFICLVSFITTWAFGLSNQMIQTETHNGIEIMTLDLRTYLNNLSNAWSTYALNFEDILPSRSWQTVGFLDWSGLFNNMALLFDWIYFPINFILYILRWFSWLINLALCIIGWPQEGSTLINILQWISQNLMIPYI